MKIRKGRWDNGKKYEFITDMDYLKAISKNKLKVNCCPFCKLEKGEDVHTRGGSWAPDTCPKCRATEFVAHEYFRDIKE